nr:unnamed protein product [Spirometra erinaceieuropaei]
MIEEIDMEIPDENDPDIFDPECDPNNPRAINFHLVLEAAERIKGSVQPTTCARSRLSAKYGMELYFKKEFEHLTGSFKERGACNTLSAFTAEQKRIGAISASTGNHSSAMALHAQKLGIPVTVVMPTIAPLPKINNCLAFGARIILKGKTISEARRVALKLAHQHGYTYINGSDAGIVTRNYEVPRSHQITRHRQTSNMIEEIDMEIPDENDPDIFDPECDPNNPRAINFHLVLEAAERIKGSVQPTTCARSRLSAKYGMELYFKKEFEHLTGSFKERGACNTLSAFTAEQKRIGAISASTGNHSSAMALHAQKLGIPVTVVMPTIAPLPKINNCLAFGARIILKGKTISEARRVALKLAHQHGYTYINGYDHPYILAGQGTIGLEILQQVPDVDAIIVPVGGAGLIAGIACAVKKLKPSVKSLGCRKTCLHSLRQHASRWSACAYCRCQCTGNIETVVG